MSARRDGTVRAAVKCMFNVFLQFCYYFVLGVHLGVDVFRKLEELAMGYERLFLNQSIGLAHQGINSSKAICDRVNS